MTPLHLYTYSTPSGRKASIMLEETETAYAVWTGIGATGSVAAGVLLFGESLSLPRLAATLAIGGGVIALKLLPGRAAPDPAAVLRSMPPAMLTSMPAPAVSPVPPAQSESGKRP